MDTRQYILDERKKGTPDDVIFTNLKKMNAPEVSSFPESPKRGLVGEVLPTVTGIAGGIIGGALGVPLGPPGIIGGAIVGSGAGGALGETAQQGLEQTFGKRKDISVGQIGAAGVTQAVLEGGGQVLGRGLKLGVEKVVKPAVDAWRKPIVNLISNFSGYAEDVVTRAMQRTPGVVLSLQRGEKALNDIIKSTVTKFHEVSNAALKAAKTKMKALDAKFSLGGRGQRASRNLVLTEARDFVGSTARVLRNEHDIGVTKGGTLLFERTSNPSRIVGVSEKNAIQESYNILNNIKKDTSISNIDSTLGRMIVLQRKTPNSTPTGPESKKVIGEMIGLLKDFAKKTYPQFAEEIEKNFKKRILISQGKEILGESANLSPKELSLLTKRILQIFNSGNLAMREAVETIGTKTEQDVVGAAAGTLMKAGEQVSVRAQNLTRRGIVEKVFEYVPRKMLVNYGITGKITGELANNASLKALAKTLGITVDALIREAVSASQNNLTE